MYVYFQLSWMDDSIIKSAKKIIVRKIKDRNDAGDEQDEASRIERLEQVLEDQNQAIRRLEQKLDLLLEKI